MVETDPGDAATEPQELLLDPFSFQVGVASRILGLGGNAPGYEPTYAFHTPYVEAAAGVAHFTVRFTGLTARRGTLQLWVYMLPMEPGAQARVANTGRVQLNRIVKDGGIAIIRFEAFRDVSFALYGSIADDTDAEAQELVVALDRPADPSAIDHAAVEARSSAFGQDKVKPAVLLISLEPAKLAAPVSQIATGPQLREPCFERWIGELRIGDLSPVEQWSSAYILQALDRYGMLQSGAIALGLGTGASPIPAALAARGITVVATDPVRPEDEHGAGADPLDALRRPAICAPDVFDRNVSHRHADAASLPGALVNFDLLWSVDFIGGLETIATALAAIEHSIGCLRPGGLAVHVGPFDLDQERRHEETPGAIFQRRQLERIALVLISRKYEVAQIKIDTRGAPLEASRNDGREVSRFGLIVRRPPSVF